MRDTTKSALKGLSQLLWLAAGLAFFFGGRALHEFAGIDRVNAEAYCWLAVIPLVVAGALLTNFANRP